MLHIKLKYNIQPIACDCMYSLFVSSSLGLWAWASSIKLMSVTGLTGENVPCKLKSEPYLQLSNGKVQLYYLMAQDTVCTHRMHWFLQKPRRVIHCSLQKSSKYTFLFYSSILLLLPLYSSILRLHILYTTACGYVLQYARIIYILIANIYWP